MEKVWELSIFVSWEDSGVLSAVLFTHYLEAEVMITEVKFRFLEKFK